MCIIRQLMYKHSIIDCYPRLLDDEASLTSAPEGCESSVSSASVDGSSQSSQSCSSFQMPRPTRSFDKTTQDILIFKKIAQIMPPKSLLHLLSGVERTSVRRRLCEEKAADAPRQLPRSLSMRKRKVRFAENVYGEVRRVVHEIPRTTDPNLWWQSKECASIRAGCKTLAEHFSQYQEDYIKSVTRLVNLKSEISIKKIEKAMECMMSNSICRGLENHIVDHCRDICRKHRENVLREQQKVLESLQDQTEEGWDRIYWASYKGSRGSRFLAVKLAQQDMLQAIGVRWDPENHILDLN